MNVRAVLNVSQIVADIMIREKCGGSIVNISSQASKAPLKDHVAYCVSKGAVDAMTRVMALELGHHNIRVNTVNPTVVMSELGQRALPDPTKEKGIIDEAPLGRLVFVQICTLVAPICRPGVVPPLPCVTNAREVTQTSLELVAYNEKCPVNLNGTHSSSQAGLV